MKVSIFGSVCIVCGCFPHTVSLCWLVAPKMTIHLTTTRPTKVSHGFIRDEYREGRAGYYHIHGLLVLLEESVKNEF